MHIRCNWVEEKEVLSVVYAVVHWLLERPIKITQPSLESDILMLSHKKHSQKCQAFFI